MQMWIFHATIIETLLVSEFHVKDETPTKKLLVWKTLRHSNVRNLVVLFLKINMILLTTTSAGVLATPHMVSFSP
jgi:hypothetical protein